MYPYLDLAGFKARTVMVEMEVDQIESIFPGYIATRIASQSSWLNSRFRKRYGASLPFGQTPPTLLPYGTNPPSLSLQGRPVLGNMAIRVEVTTAGSLGTAIIRWTKDGGVTHTAHVTSAASIVLAGTGMTLTMSGGLSTYSTDNAYQSATPVPEVVLGWLTVLVTLDVYRRRGVNPQDPVIEMVTADVKRVYEEVKEEADSKDGLFDIPTSEDQDSAVTTGGPIGYSETSPYIWTDIQRAGAVAEDRSTQGDD